MACVCPVFMVIDMDIMIRILFLWHTSSNMMLRCGAGVAASRPRGLAEYTFPAQAYLFGGHDGSMPCFGCHSWVRFSGAQIEPSLTSKG